MAQKIRVELVCDACEDGRPAQRTLGFAFDDESGERSEYKVELCARHMAQFVGAMQQWIEMARLEPIQTKALGRGKSRAINGAATVRQTNGRAPARRGAEQVAAIRTWARAHGYTVAEKGRIPTEIEEAYNRRATV
ncbi:MAG: histone-like nucleoid-structuring protein Lsr2 [Acidimicrobiales bacterium]